ncbi:DUF262 domain-containing protein [Paraburkholderia fynbosensis]|uniref:DUF262 domain-containing protein n=1 Tax=Paraburkholderia fynbosensis TaxID=1200993 RepID=A0A6J5G2R6_9BURK|nr:DUF262 domain-containing protein [Paraburkholderia fynbosensis]CAB3790911.1 hypothetical protein LMG27177_02944 [Paraburkholderia fynbosensis]
MEPSKQPLSKLLTIEGTQESYRIPKYQRPYSWTADDWQQLLDDINDDANDGDGHYMGSVICVDVSSGAPGEPRIFELIDGQQRLTTISCLLVAVWTKLNEIYTIATDQGDDSELDEDDRSDLKEIADDIRRKVVREKRYQKEETLPPSPSGGSIANDFFVGRKGRTDYFSRLLPSSQDSNRDDYLYALAHFGILPALDIQQPRNWGNRRVAKCLRYLTDELPDDIATLKLLTQRINSLVFIHIKVASQSDAFRLFEAINNRGVPLSALDIIKNAMLAALERQTPGSIDEAFETWSAMTERLGSETGLHESYLRHFYNAFQFEPGRRVPRANRATKSKLIDIFDQLIKNDAQTLLDDLAARAVFYGAITNPEDANLSASRQQRLINLAHIEARPSYQFLLYLFDRESKGKCSATDVDKVIDLLARFFVRRNLTGVPATNRLDALFVDLIEKSEAVVSHSKAVITYDFVRDAMLNAPRGDAPASDEDLESALKDHLYWYNPSMARYLLCRYAETRMTKEQFVDLWRRDEKGRYVWTIEHVLPQGTPLKKAWAEMLADGDKDEAATIQDEHAHLLGNLTLSAYNSNLSDAAFPDKQKKTTVTVAGEKASIGYQNGMVLNEVAYRHGNRSLCLATTDAWNENHILARGDVLSNAMLKDYRI